MSDDERSPVKPEKAISSNPRELTETVIKGARQKAAKELGQEILKFLERSEMKHPHIAYPYPAPPLFMDRMEREMMALAKITAEEADCHFAVLWPKDSIKKNYYSNNKYAFEMPDVAPGQMLVMYW